MHLELFTEIEELPRLNTAWEALWEQLGETASPFSTYDWYEIWWRHYSADGQLHVLALRDAGKLVGIAPLMLRRATLHGLPATVLCFIDNNQTFLNDFVVAPDYREIFLRKVLNALFEQDGSRAWDAVVLNKLSTFSPNYPVLVGLLEAGGRTWRQEQTVDGRYLMPSGSWQEYLSGRSKRTRKTLRNIQNGIQKAGTVSIRNVRTWDECQEIWDEVCGVARGSWAENHGDSMASPSNRPFFDDLARTAAARGWLSVWTLRLDDRMIAIEFHLRTGGREYAMRGHYLPEHAALSPGTFLEMQVLKSLFEEGEVQKYEMGNFYSYKQKWTDLAEPQMAVWIFNQRPYSTILAFHEMKAVPLLRSVFPQSLWENRIFRICGIKTHPFDIKQH